MFTLLDSLVAAGADAGAARDLLASLARRGGGVGGLAAVALLRVRLGHRVVLELLAALAAQLALDRVGLDAVLERAALVAVAERFVALGEVAQYGPLGAPQ